MDALCNSNNAGLNSKEKINMLKKGLTLDLNAARNSRKQKFFSPILSSPDLKMLKLASPELEKLIIQHNSLATPTPTQIFFPKNTVTEEQEMFAKGFQDQLAELHNSDGGNSCGPKNSVDIFNISTNSRNISSTSESSDDKSCNNYLIGCNLHRSEIADSNSFVNPSFVTQILHVKGEPTTNMRSSSPVSPIDMETQEKIKLERKRQRNRIAASKCRRRKLERIAKLEEKVKHLSGENNELMTVVNKLRNEVYCLKQEVAEHIHCGCEISANQSIELN